MRSTAPLSARLFLMGGNDLGAQLDRAKPHNPHTLKRGRICPVGVPENRKEQGVENRAKPDQAGPMKSQS